MNTKIARRLARILLAAFVLSLLCVFAAYADTEDAAEEVGGAGYIEFVKNEIGEEYESEAEYAQAYIDNYADALQSDPDVKANYEAAISLVRENYDLGPAPAGHRHRSGADHQRGVLLPVRRYRRRRSDVCELPHRPRV